MAAFYRWDGTTLVLQVSVRPGAQTFSLGQVRGETLRVNVHAPAREGRATEELLKGLAKEFAVPPGAVTLVYGAFQKRKVVRIISPGRLPAGINPPG